MVQMNEHPKTDAYVSNSSVSMGTGIAALVVGLLAGFYGAVYYGATDNIPTKYDPRFFQLGVVIAVMAVIFFGFAIENDHWTWEGDKLVTKDYWEDCDSYMEGICETMDQWNEKKC